MNYVTERPQSDPQAIVQWIQRLARKRDRGCEIGQSIYTKAVNDMAWWLQAIQDDEQRNRLLARFAMLQREDSDSPAFDRWLRDYALALSPPRPWRETLQEEIALRRSRWDNWLRHEVSPKRRAKFETCTPAAMLACLKIKEVVDRETRRMLYASCDTPPEMITEEIVAELMISDSGEHLRQHG